MKLSSFIDTLVLRLEQTLSNDMRLEQTLSNDMCALLRSTEFDTHYIQDSTTLKNIAIYLFQELLKDLPIQISLANLIHFIDLVFEHYHPNPFHNIKHAINVLHMTHLLVERVRVKHKLKPHVLFALYISALCHDVDHPGHTNIYEVSSFGKFAKIYNDKSVLEKHHCAKTFALLEQSGLISPFDYQFDHQFGFHDYYEFRTTIMYCILGTDLSKHMKCIRQIKRFDSKKPKYSIQEQYVFCKIILHCADLSSSIKSFDSCFQWSKRISTEFYREYMKDKRKRNLGSPWMCVNTTSKLCANEILFIKNISIPLWSAFSDAFEHSAFTIQHCRKNLEIWEKLNTWLDSLRVYLGNQYLKIGNNLK